MTARFPPRRGKESDWRDMWKRGGAARATSESGRGRPRRLSSTSPQLAFHGHSHAQGVALLQQTSPFKGKTCPVPIDSSTSPCRQQSAIPCNRTFPRPEYESPVFGQSHVRRLQRSSKERSRIHSVREESPPQAGQWTIIRRGLAAYVDNQKASRLTSLRDGSTALKCCSHLPSISYQWCHEDMWCHLSAR
jgi:hypothetical protein